MKRLLLAVPVLAAALTAVGCAAGYRGYSGYGGGYGYVRVAPPPPRAEVYGYAPGPGYVWAPGYWAWDGGRYHWRSGSWVRRPHARANWVPGRWEHNSRGYY